MIKHVHLWAIGFDDTGRAEQVRREIMMLHDKHWLILHDSAVAVRYPDGSVTLDGELFVPAIQFSGGKIARFFAGLMLGAPPLSGAAVGTLMRTAGGAAAELGIDDKFIGEVEAFMKPGTSALFVLDQEGDLEAIL
jgi:uncharacterized membrane protein